LRALVSAGFCGALSPELRVGDLVAPDEVRDEASGESFAPDPEMLAAAPGARGTLVSAVRLARTPADRARLDGLAVDMESAALARASRAAGIPFLALRAVTDETRHRLPDFDGLMDAAGRLTPGAGLLYFLRHPRDVPALVRLGPAVREAGRALRAGLEQTLRRLR
jgi:adenosylhomocysteine nucleosidase